MLSVALLLARLGVGQHLHLCLDRAGLEPPVAVHAGVEHAADGTHILHTDLNLSLAADMVEQKFGRGAELLSALLAVVVLWLVAPVGRLAVPAAFASACLPVIRFHIRPPLRAPPG